MDPTLLINSPGLVFLPLALCFRAAEALGFASLELLSMRSNKPTPAGFNVTMQVEMSVTMHV